MVVWTPGADKGAAPPEAAFALGGADGPTYLSLQARPARSTAPA
jgi:hypothetical protein